MGSEEKDDECGFRSISFKMPVEQPGGEKESIAEARALGIAGRQRGVEVIKHVAGHVENTEWRQRREENRGQTLTSGAVADAPSAVPISAQCSLFPNVLMASC